MKTIEKHTMDVYKEVKKELPGLHCLVFEVHTFPHSGETKTSGFMHVGSNCIPFEELSEIQKYIKKTKERRNENEILFRRF